MKLWLLLLFILTCIYGEENMSLYDFKVKTIEGKEISLDQYKGKVLLIVNVASLCGFTPQYEDLQKLHIQYKDKGLAILGFPCNQFMEQEPKNNNEIKEFCSINYGVSFDMFEKIDVNGDNTHPLYVYLKKQATGILSTQSIKWNFTKFLVSKDTKEIIRYAPNTKPFELQQDIQRFLQEETQ